MGKKNDCACLAALREHFLTDSVHHFIFLPPMFLPHCLLQRLPRTFPCFLSGSAHGPHIASSDCLQSNMKMIRRHSLPTWRAACGPIANEPRIAGRSLFASLIVALLV